MEYSDIQGELLEIGATFKIRVTFRNRSNFLEIGATFRSKSNFKSNFRDKKEKHRVKDQYMAVYKIEKAYES